MASPKRENRKIWMRKYVNTLNILRNNEINKNVKL